MARIKFGVHVNKKAHWLRLATANIAAVLLTASASTFAITGSILPAAPISEPVVAGQDINFDILVHNDTQTVMTLEKVVVEYFDENGERLLKRELSNNGAAPSIKTIENRNLQPGEEKLFFNPFPNLQDKTSVARVHADLEFSSLEADGKTRTTKRLTLDAPMSSRKASVVLLPLKGRILLWDSHDLMAHHRRWDYSLPYLKQLGFSSNAMRYSYDFVPVNASNQLSAENPSRNEDWFGFGTPVRAVADGVVVKTVFQFADDRSFNPEASLKDSNALFGNYVVIEHPDHTFSLYGHLKQFSVKVLVGEKVKGGQDIAAIGNSGSAEFPHLHFQMMDSIDMKGEGVPSLFRNFTRKMGKTSVRVSSKGAIENGSVISTNE